MKMMINITTPKEISYLRILLRTKKYYHLKGLSDVIEDIEKKYYIFIRKRNIQIKIVCYENTTIDEIENYLDYTFKDNYLGMQKKYSGIIHLKGAKIINI